MAQLTLSLGMLAMAFFTVAYGGFVRPLRAQARSPGRFGAVHLRGSQLHDRRQPADAARRAHFARSGIG